MKHSKIEPGDFGIFQEFWSLKRKDCLEILFIFHSFKVRFKSFPFSDFVDNYCNNYHKKGSTKTRKYSNLRLRNRLGRSCCCGCDCRCLCCHNCIFQIVETGKAWERSIYVRTTWLNKIKFFLDAEACSVYLFCFILFCLWVWIISKLVTSFSPDGFTDNKVKMKFLIKNCDQNFSYNFYLWYQCGSELSFLAFQDETHRLQFGHSFHVLHFSAFRGNSLNMPFLCYPQAMRLDSYDTFFEGFEF